MRKVKRFVKENTNSRKTSELQSPVLRLKSGAGDGIRTRGVLLGKLPRDKLAFACQTNRLPPFLGQLIIPKAETSSPSLYPAVPYWCWGVLNNLSAKLWLACPPLLEVGRNCKKFVCPLVFGWRRQVFSKLRRRVIFTNSQKAEMTIGELYSTRRH